STFSCINYSDIISCM
ncbi:hypothetical protein AVEN_271176-1, partial [Araneus ventricosus]